eukprot:UN15500
MMHRSMVRVWYDEQSRSLFYCAFGADLMLVVLSYAVGRGMENPAMAACILSTALWFIPGIDVAQSLRHIYFEDIYFQSRKYEP